VGQAVARAVPIELGANERSALQATVRATTSEQRAARRARIVLLASGGASNAEIAREVRVSENTVRLWRGRFKLLGPAGLRDAPRSGRPAVHSAEAKARVVARAVRPPTEDGRPFTHWSSSELARLAEEAGITGPIHPSTVWRWLNAADLKPHRIRYWLKITDPDFEPRMRDVTSTYLRAQDWWAEGSPVFCVDEKTSMQALQRMTPDLPAKPGKPPRRDHRYFRRGSTTLLGALHVATGKVWGYFVPERPATVFAEFIRRLCASVPKAPKIHVVMDQVSTHWHLEVCRVVADMSGVTFEPRKLANGAQRKAFLADSGKRVVVHFTPVRASWLDQIEIWFSMLGRKVLNRGSFASLSDLQARVLEFVDHYNRHMARPFRWTYTGTPCRT
jgi:transposase